MGDFGSKYASARYIVRSGNPKGKRTKRSTLGLEILMMARHSAGDSRLFSDCGYIIMYIN